MIYNNTIEELLEELRCKINNIDEIVKDFIRFYWKNHRHRYAKVAKYINDKAVYDEQIAYFILSNIMTIKNYCMGNKEKVCELIKDIINDSESEFNYDKLIENLEKLQDHIELETQRINFSQNRENSIFSGLINQMNNSIQSAKNDIDEKSNKIEDRLNTTVITTLGIFSAIVVVFFGGLGSIGSIFSNLKGISKYRIVFTISLEGFVMFNSIFLLLYCVAKIMNKDIGTNKWPPFNLQENYYKLKYEYDNIDKSDTENLNEIKQQIVKAKKRLSKYENSFNCGFLKLVTRYPIVFWVNTFLIFLIIGTGILKIIIDR